MSAIAWSVVVVLFWFFVGEDMGAWFGLPPAAEDAAPIIGITVFWSKPFLWFYLYFAVAVLAFYTFWSRFSPHPWQNWSILGSSLILFITYFQVQVSVAVNNWYGPFWDYVQGIMAKTLTSTAPIVSSVIRQERNIRYTAAKVRIMIGGVNFCVLASVIRL